MYISKIHIVGYRNFKDKEISFKEGINVIIGPNNAGKSNLLRALDLVLNTETTKKLTLFDFCRDSNLNELKVAAPKVRIEVFFRESEGSNSEDLVMVAPCLIKLEHPYEAQVTFDYFLPKEDEDEYKNAVSDITDEEKIWNIIRDEYLRKYVSRMWAGNPTNQSKLDGETVDKIDFEFLAPIRDVERDLFSGKSPLLREVLNFFLDYEIKSNKGIDIAATHNGLGYNNLIYISLLLAKMQTNADEGYYRQNAKVFSVLAIEEPEAHLHLSLQYKFLKYLQEEQVKKKRVRQLFITTHSTEITSAVSLDELICLYNDLEDKIAVGYPGSLFDDSEGDIVSKQYVQRFLDAIKSDMLFADRICFVEGKAEELLIPVMANYIEKSIEDGHVAVISVGGRYFSHFLKLFDTIRNPLAMKKKVVCLTDRDPMWRKEDSNSFERCYPFEHGLEGNEYQEHSKTMIETFHEHPNIRVYSQDEIKGKTLEYDLMW